MPVAVTVFAVPTFLSLKVVVEVNVRTSPAMRLSVYETDAAVVALYTLFEGVIPITNVRFVMSAVVVADVFCV